MSLVVPVRPLDIVVEENALGFIAGGERRYLFLDGIIDITKYLNDVWTIQHWNGMVVNVPASQIRTNK
jgi:hypothetical protein